MLHRMALRVLPSLSLAVTEETVRKQKRIVMFVPGLVAFGVYRLVKHLVPISDPLVLLTVSSLVATVTSVLAYRIGRSAPWSVIVREDGARLLSWLAGWIGAVYGIQLSLLVLTLLWIMNYDYLQHPDGPAMMAIIISCTAVARDAFEIGHVRKLSLLGRPFLTFPDGEPLRALVQRQGLAIGTLGRGGSWYGCGCIVVGDSHRGCSRSRVGSIVECDGPRRWPGPLCVFWRTLSVYVVGPYAPSDRSRASC